MSEARQTPRENHRQTTSEGNVTERFIALLIGGGLGRAELVGLRMEVNGRFPNPRGALP
jgi:hypothetical protein